MKDEEKPKVHLGKYYSVKAKTSPEEKEMMCDMAKEGINVYDVDPTGFAYVHVGDAKKNELAMMDKLVRDGFRVLHVEGKPPGCTPGHPC